MKKSKFFILLIAIIFASCGHSVKTNENSRELAKDTLQTEQVEMTEFQQYLSHFPKKDLPIIIYCTSSEFLYSFKENEFPNYNEGFSDAFAQIQTNGNYLATIIMAYTDCNVPVLTTYTYDGKVIDSKEIFISDGIDIGYSAIVSTTINKDFTIYVSDSVATYDVDTISGEEIEGTRKEYVLYQEGKLLPTGKIELAEIQKKVI